MIKAEMPQIATFAHVCLLAAASIALVTLFGYLRQTYTALSAKKRAEKA